MATSTNDPSGLMPMEELYAGLTECELSGLLPNGLPRYLFRAERDGYPETHTSMDRLYHVAREYEHIYDELDDLTAFVMKQPFKDKDLRGREAAAFAQHYGLPTQVYDFTSSAKVAMSFAANRSYHKEKAKGGNMAILDVQKALAAEQVIDDLRHHRYARRAKLQSAFGFIYTGFRADDFYNLKDEEIVRQVGLIWVPFKHTENDEEFLQRIDAQEDILSTDGDPFASLAQDFVDERVRINGPFSEDAAMLLSKNVPAIGRTQNDNFLIWSGKKDLPKA